MHQHGGEKVFPDEVEAALKDHPDVRDAIVIGMPDARYGERVDALVQPRAGRRIDTEGLRQYGHEQVDRRTRCRKWSWSSTRSSAHRAASRTMSGRGRSPSRLGDGRSEWWRRHRSTPG